MEIPPLCEVVGWLDYSTTVSDFEDGADAISKMRKNLEFVQ